ncbi:MAG: Lrp/AsnC family transcriptional regulator [Euryarchaeota archaeon]|nr:Lrp/AsnC family transcriptional regulator [Euryarchaeota archaeon]
MKKLRRDGVIRRFTALVNPNNVGYAISAVVSIRSNANDTLNIAQQLSTMKRVSEVYTVVGEYDIVAKILAKDMNDLKEFVEQQLISLPGIKEARTNVIFSSIKDEPSIEL